MRILILFFLALATQSAKAADYYFKIEAGFDNYLVGNIYSSVEGACTAVTQAMRTKYPNFLVNQKPPVFVSGVDYRCVVNYAQAAWAAYEDRIISNVKRYGDSCPPDTTFNQSLGICEGDPCLLKKDQDQPVSKSGIRGDSFVHCFKTTDGKTLCSHATTACFNGCAVELPMGSGFKCTYDTAGQYRCSGSGYYSGTSCSSEVPSSDPDPDGTDPVPMEKTSDEPCIYGTVNGVTSCEQRNRLDSEGIFGGEGTCTGDGCSPAKDATSKEDKIKTEISSETNSNGVTTTTKKDTKTQTKCTGTDTNCTTSTTTKTTTTKTDASGNTTSTTGTCSGPQCESNTNPDADGDGFGDCVGDDCGEGEDASSVAGESCGVELSCEGDAIQCAILRQEKENNCKWRLGAEEESAITASVSGEGFELEEKNIDGASLFNEAISQGRWLTASCPPPRSISVMGNTITFSWEPVCEFAIAMGPFVVALATLFFSVYVFRGVKGS